MADSIILLWGWRRWALAFLSGALLVLALPPFNVAPVGWISIPILIWMIDGAATPEGTGFIRRLLPAAGVGWWFGFGYFAAGLWWIGVSFLVEADVFAWLMPLAVIALPAGLALFWAAGTALARLLWSDGWPRVFVLAAIMTATEWVRGHVLTGFPWNTVGYAITPDPLLMQSASIIGIWGITLLAFLVFGLPAILIGDRGRGRAFATVLIIALVIAHTGFGLVRLRGADDAVVEGVRLRIVQAAIPQDVKQDAAEAPNNFRRHLDLSRAPAPAADRPTHIIWPESAVPYYLTEQAGPLSAIADMLGPDTFLITGAQRPQRGGDDPGVFNSVVVINTNGEIVDSYDKVHLVPFGEYLPFADLLEGIGIRQLITLPGGFKAGLSRRTLTAGEAPAFSPMVCYEAIFPLASIDDPGSPGWLLNVTNDAWFGNTPGPHQHFRQSILRTVEQGLPMVRAANTGISAIVDPYGRIVGQLGLGESGVVDGDLPAALPRTVYARFGDGIPTGLVLVTFLTALLGRWVQRNRYN